MPHGIIMTVIIGFIVGLIAKVIMGGREPAGFLTTVVIGIAGSFFGTFLGRAVGHYQDGQGAGFLMSLVGACILLAIYHFFTRNSAQA